MKWLKIIGLVIVLAIVIYKTGYPSTTVRYRLTLEADVDGKPVSASSVREVTYAKQSEFAGQRPLIVSYRGEAIALDLGECGTLFALLKGGTDSRSGPESIVLRAFDFPGGHIGPIDDGLLKLQRLSGKRELSFTSLPLLVRFRDINDPKTVEKVDPFDLQKLFGPGVRLTRATLEIVPAGIWPFRWYGITGEPLTDSLEKKLVWLKGTRGGYLDGKFAGGGPALLNLLHGGDFKTGLYP